MKKIVIFGCQQIAVDFIRYVVGQRDVELSLVVTYELTLDKIQNSQRTSALHDIQTNDFPALIQ